MCDPCAILFYKKWKCFWKLFSLRWNSGLWGAFLLSLFIPSRAFWLRSSVLSVLLSLISETWSVSPAEWLGRFLKPIYLVVKKCSVCFRTSIFMCACVRASESLRTWPRYCSISPECCGLSHLLSHYSLCASSDHHPSKHTTAHILSVFRLFINIPFWTQFYFLFAKIHSCPPCSCWWSFEIRFCMTLSTLLLQKESELKKIDTVLGLFVRCFPARLLAQSPKIYMTPLTVVKHWYLDGSEGKKQPHDIMRFFGVDKEWENRMRPETEQSKSPATAQFERNDWNTNNNNKNVRKRSSQTLNSAEKQNSLSFWFFRFWKINIKRKKKQNVCDPCAILF